MKKILFVVLMAAGLSACSSSPDGTVKSYYTDIDAGKLEDAKTFISDGIKSTFGSKLDAGLQKETASYMAHNGIDSIEIKCDTKGEVAVCASTLTFKDGFKKPQNDKLAKTKDGWRFTM